VNDPFIIGQQNKMVAINTALEVDLTGQVCADSLGTQFYSGIGGQADSTRARHARWTDGPSSPSLHCREGQGVAHRRHHQARRWRGHQPWRVHYVVTEYGIAYLHGKTVQERAMALISIAHPDFREELLSKAIELQVRPSGDGGRRRPHLHRAQGAQDHHALGRRDAHQLPSHPPHRRQATRDLFYSLSQETVYYRYMSHMKRIPRKQMQNFVYVDHRNEVAIVGTVPEASGDEIIAIGRYYLDQKSNRPR
jgi:hypothetical protein